MARTLRELWKRLNRKSPGLFLDPAIASGQYEVFYRDESTRGLRRLFTQQNLLLYTWGHVTARCLTGDVSYKLSAAYLEYENVAAPGDAVSVPSYGRGDGRSYYEGLGGNRDYLRLALAGTPAIDIAPGFESYFTAGVDGNRLTAVLQSAGTQGVLGRAFSDVVNSKACGIALVATPVAADRSRDVILSRGYFAVPDQPLKLAGSQIEVHWKISLR